MEQIEYALFSRTKEHGDTQWSEPTTSLTLAQHKMEGWQTTPPTLFIRKRVVQIGEWSDNL